MYIKYNSFKTLLPLITILLIVSIACTERNATTKSSTTSGNGDLVVYSGRSESLVKPIIEQFEAASGINVKVKYGKTGAIAATLLEEGRNSPADIFFAQDPSGLAAIAKAGMLKPLDSSILDKVPTWAKSKESLWVGFSGRARTVVYNTKNISPEDLPASIEGFTNPKWNGRIGWPPSNSSFQAMVTAMRVEWGEERTRKWLEGIQANNPKIYPKNTPTVAAVAAGEIDVGFVNHYYLHRFIAEQGEGFGARNHHLDSGGVGSVILITGAGIINTSKNEENAKKFLNFMLSPVAQQYFTEKNYEYPLVDEVKANPLLIPIDSINKPSIDMASLDDLAGTQKLLKDVGLIN